MSRIETIDLHGLLSCLARHEVRGVIIGGMGAVLQGAPIHTEDVDMVHDRSDENLDRLMAALQDLHAIYRWQHERRIEARRDILAGTGHNLLATDLGGLDLLGELQRGVGYEQLRGNSVTMTLAAGPIEVLELSKIIELKRAAGRPKDLRVLAELESTERRIRAARSIEDERP